MTVSDDYVPAWQWKERALRAEKQAADAMSCMKKMGDCKDIPAPWRSVIQCGYIGCGGVNWWKEKEPLRDRCTPIEQLNVTANLNEGVE